MLVFKATQNHCNYFKFDLYKIPIQPQEKLHNLEILNKITGDFDGVLDYFVNEKRFHSTAL
jgi:hypothetical protein